MATEKLKFKIELVAEMWDKPPIAEVSVNGKTHYKKEIPKSYSLMYKLTALTTHINILHCHQRLYLVLENGQWMRF